MTKFRVLALLAGVVFAGVTSPGSAAVVYFFSGQDAGGTGSATMAIDIAGNTLTAKVNNTSPITLDSGLGANAPAITSFGLNLLNSPLPGVTSWNLDAHTNTGFAVNLGTSLGSGSPWQLLAPGTVAGTTVDVLLDSVQAVQGALYNPAVLASPLASLALAAPPRFFTEATLTITFDEAPQLEELFGSCSGPLHTCSPFIRMQNVGDNGPGSLKLAGSPGTPPQQAPEPGTLLLAGIALLAIAMMRRRASG